MNERDESVRHLSFKDRYNEAGKIWETEHNYVQTPPFHVLTTFADYLYQISVSKFHSVIIHIIYSIVFI